MRSGILSGEAAAKAKKRSMSHFMRDVSLAEAERIEKEKEKGKAPAATE
jgi:hypothetical protein